MTKEPPKELPVRLTDLLPACPFCGSNLNEVGSVPFDEQNGRVIVCSRCGAQGPKRWPPSNRQPLELPEARAAWSQRTAPPAK